MSFDRQVCDQIPHLRRYATALCGDPAAADDLVQASLERALRKRHLFHSRGRMRSWLFRILYRTYLNGHASAYARRESATSEAGESLTTEGSQQLHVHCHDVIAKVDNLPDDQRAALLLMALENPSYREAARILDIKVGTLRSRLARARDAVEQAGQEAVDDHEKAPQRRIRSLQ